MVIAGIVAGLLVIALILVLIIRGIAEKDEPHAGETGKKKMVVNEHGADVNSGKLGSDMPLFRGYGHENMDTVCMSQELYQKQMYSARLKQIRLTDCETGNVWESAFTSEIYIGRTPNPEGRASIVIHCQGISSQHCRIYVEGMQILIADLNSTNGTYLNNDAISTPQTIKKGDIIGMGVKNFAVGFI